MSTVILDVYLNNVNVNDVNINNVNVNYVILNHVILKTTTSLDMTKKDTRCETYGKNATT